MDQPVIARPVPRIDTLPAHTCGTAYRAGVATVGCPGCFGRLSHTAVTFRAAAVVSR